MSMFRGEIRGLEVFWKYFGNNVGSNLEVFWKELGSNFVASLFPGVIWK